jgi:hypothetical protein
VINLCIRCPNESITKWATSTGERHLCSEHAGEYIELMENDVDVNAVYDIDFLIQTLDDVLAIEPEVRYDGDPQYFEAVIDEAQVVVNAIKRLLD